MIVGIGFDLIWVGPVSTDGEVPEIADGECERAIANDLVQVPSLMPPQMFVSGVIRVQVDGPPGHCEADHSEAVENPCLDAVRGLEPGEYGTLHRGE